MPRCGFLSVEGIHLEISRWCKLVSQLLVATTAADGSKSRNITWQRNDKTDHYGVKELSELYSLHIAIKILYYEKNDVLFVGLFNFWCVVSFLS